MKSRQSIIALLLMSVAIFAQNIFARKEIFIDKTALRLYVIDDNDTICSYPISAGMNYGQKKRAGDHKTPEGSFSISMIQPSDSWTHNFHDGNGPVRGAYGPWFFRLKTPMSTHIGIHGTCFPSSIGTRSSEGCIRLTNRDIKDLHKYVYVGMKVYISEDPVR